MPICQHRFPFMTSNTYPKICPIIFPLHLFHTFSFQYVTTSTSTPSPIFFFKALTKLSIFDDFMFVQVLPKPLSVMPVIQFSIILCIPSPFLTEYLPSSWKTCFRACSHPVWSKFSLHINISFPSCWMYTFVQIVTMKVTALSLQSTVPHMWFHAFLKLLRYR